MISRIWFWPKSPDSHSNLSGETGAVHLFDIVVFVE
jgi:hypothetical protein